MAERGGRRSGSALPRPDFACEPEVRLAGGTYIDLSPTDAYVDGTMVSAKGWTALAAFIRECLKVLGTQIRHE